MPRFEHDPTSVTAVITVFEKGELEFIVGEPSAFYNAGKQNPKTGEQKPDNYGVRYKLTVAEGLHKGEFTFYNCFYHTDGSIAFSKQFLMACLGYKATSAEEQRFNAKYKGSDWGIDTDTKAVGDVWREPTGKRLKAAVDVTMNTENGQAQQKWVKFLTL